MEQNQEKPIDRWRNRRKMAWIAFLFLVTLPLYFLFIPSHSVESFSSIAIVYIGSLTTIITSYFGFATLDKNNH